jgi:TPR repeat protein
MYRRGQGVSQDYQQAMYWSMKAASAGNAEAQYLVGFFYYWGIGVLKNYKQAMDWFLKSADNGSTDAMNEIGYMYRSGEGVTENIPTAIEWYTKAANQGSARSQFWLGHTYHYEDEVKNLQLAVNWLQKAADNDDWLAKEEVKELNKQGYYAKGDEQEGILISCIYFMKLIIKSTKHSSRRRSTR